MMLADSTYFCRDEVYTEKEYFVGYWGYHLNSYMEILYWQKKVVQAFLQDVMNATDVMCIVYINMKICTYV